MKGIVHFGRRRRRRVDKFYRYPQGTFGLGEVQSIPKHTLSKQTTKTSLDMLGSVAMEQN